jgi:hypothetical protein
MTTPGRLPMPATSPDRTAAVGALLRDLLTFDPRYRQLWHRREARHRSELSQAAVAKVIEEYLWDSGERNETLLYLARQLKDRVSRALRGERLSAETLTWFISAFQMEDGDTNRLWEIYDGKTSDSFGISHTLQRHREMIRRQRHRTLSLVERYMVDRNGAMILRRTHHTIRAIEDGVDIYIYNHEPEASAVQVVHGGNIGHHYTYGDGLTSVEIALDRRLAVGETTVLEYRTLFTGRTIHLTEVRRAAFGRCENVDFAVEFNDLKTPMNAWWCAWDDHFDGACVMTRPVDIRNGVIRQFVPYIEETVVGFRWEW